MEIILHAGTHKTGTTSFQNLLRRRAETLRASGVRVMTPESWLNIRNPRRFDPERVRREMAESAAQGMERVVISREAFCNLAPAQLAEMVRLLRVDPAIRLRYVAVFRHWTSFLPSRWHQNCRRRDGQSLPRFLDRLAAEPELAAVFRFERMIADARAAGIESVAALSWDNAVAAEDDLMALLSEACGLPGLQAQDQPPAERRSNATRDPRDQERIRLFNALRARAAGTPRDPLCDNMSKEWGEGDFYDQGSAVRRALAAAPDMTAEIDARLDARRIELALTQEDFAEWEASLEQVALPVLLNPREGRLFASAPTLRLTPSTLEAEDLPEALRARMLRALERARAPRPVLVRGLAALARAPRRLGRRARV